MRVRLGGHDWTRYCGRQKQRGHPGTDPDELIAFGPLLSDDGAAWVGTAALVRAPGPDRARAVLAPHQYAETEVHDWEFGGRR